MDQMLQISCFVRNASDIETPTTLHPIHPIAAPPLPT